MIDVKEIGEEIKRIRKSRGITTEELETISGVTRRSITALETGKAAPTLKTLVKLSEALDHQIKITFEPSED